MLEHTFPHQTSIDEKQWEPLRCPMGARILISLMGAYDVCELVAEVDDKGSKNSIGEQYFPYKVKSNEDVLL